MSGAKGVVVLPDHVRVDFDATASEAWRGCADVLCGAGEPGLADRLLARYPGCLLVSVRDRANGRCVAVARGGGRIEVGPVRDEREHALLASSLYRLIVALSGCPAPVTVHSAAGRRAG